MDAWEEYYEAGADARAAAQEWFDHLTPGECKKREISVASGIVENDGDEDDPNGVANEWYLHDILSEDEED